MYYCTYYGSQHTAFITPGIFLDLNHENLTVQVGTYLRVGLAVELLGCQCPCPGAE